MIRMFFGSPGCGKTTLAVRSIVKMKKHEEKIEKARRRPFLHPFTFFCSLLFPPSFYRYYFTNFETSVCPSVSLAGLGEWTFPPSSFVVVDESGIEFNNRSYKSLPRETIQFFKLHRHFKVDLDFFSQSWEDTDITVRRLADEYWHVRRLGPFTICRKIKKFVTVQEDTKQIIDGYEFKPIIKQFLPFPFHEHTVSFFWRRPYYKYFNSFSVPDGVPVRFADPQ